MARWRELKKNKFSKNNTRAKDSINLCDALLMARFKAFITDSFMLLIPIMYIVFYFIMGSREAFAADKTSGWVYIFIPHFIAVVSFWYFKAQTPGMRAYEVSLIDVTSGLNPSLFQLIIRYISMSILMFLVFPILFPYFNKNKRTLWDIISKTCVKSSPVDLV